VNTLENKMCTRKDINPIIMDSFCTLFANGTNIKSSTDAQDSNSGDEINFLLTVV
jgi:hypothetical protein